MDFSVIIPIFEESQKIAADIAAASEFMLDYGLNGEIIVIDDGSQDNSCKIAESVTVPDAIKLRIAGFDKHRGKGAAVRTGMQMSKGKCVMFADSGSCVPFDCARTGMEMIKRNYCDIAHASRRLPESRIILPHHPHRRAFSILFRWLVIPWMKIPAKFTDTQCGFKIYNGDVARQLYGQAITNGFMFDVEIILRALQGGFRIKEFPIRWTADRDTRLNRSFSLWRMFAELQKIRRTLDR